MTPGYRLVMAAPSVTDYLRLRRESGLTPKSEEPGVAARPGAWVNLLADPPGRALYACHGFTQTAPDSVGMAMSLEP